MLTFYLREVPMSLHYSARVSSLLDAIANKLKPNSITLAGSELVLSWFEPDRVMEFGF